jgi:hypothetical protein
MPATVSKRMHDKLICGETERWLSAPTVRASAPCTDRNDRTEFQP